MKSETPWMDYQLMKLQQEYFRQQEALIHTRLPDWLKEIYIKRDKEEQAKLNTNEIT